MLLVGASGHCLCFSRNKLFLEILLSGEKMLVSRNLRLGFRVSKLDSFEARLLLRFFFVTQLSISLPYLSRKIEGSLLTGYKLINNNFFKDRSFQRYLVLDILTNPVRVTLTKNVTFWWKIHCQFRCLHTFRWRLNLPLS